MKFLLNMNIPRQLGRLLQEQGHSVRHAADVGLASASDHAIVDAARANGEVIVTHDLDYGHLLAFAGTNAPSVIIFRLPQPSVDGMMAALAAAWQNIEQPLIRGAIVVIEDSAVRVRELPVKSPT